MVLACVCGSDLWYYRGESDQAVGSIGHEFIGVVEDVGSEVRNVVERRFRDLPVHLQRQDLPALPARLDHQRVPAAGSFGNGAVDGGQGEAVRVPLADGTLVPVPGSGHSDETMTSLLTLSDVHGHRPPRRRCAGVKPGDTVAVVGDGAVGLSAVLASNGWGPSGSSRSAANPTASSSPWSSAPPTSSRRAARRPTEAVVELTGGIGADAALECVGTAAVDATAAAIARPGSMVGFVGVPHGEVPFGDMFFRNVGWTRRPRPGPRLHPGAPARRARGADQPRPGVRLRDRSRPCRGGLRGDGRASRDQVSNPGGVVNHPHQESEHRTVTWTADQLALIGDAEELRLASRRERRDAALVHHDVGRPCQRRPVRPVGRRAARPWYRHALASGRGRVQAGGTEADVSFAGAAPDAQAAIDSAYHAKYDRYGPAIVGHVTGPSAHAVTIRLLPDNEEGRSP